MADPKPADKLPLVEKLNEDQSTVALDVIKEAKRLKIEPRLALSIAFQESRLDPNAPEREEGRVGLMGASPAMATGLGFKPKDLGDPQKNLRIGLTYLKQGVDKFGDPVLAAAGYNAGMDHPYFDDPDNNSLPDSTKSYLKDIKGYGGFTTTPSPDEAQEQIEPASEADYRRSLAAGVLGAGIGGAGGAALGGGKSAINLAGKAADLAQNVNTVAGALKGGQFVPTPEQAARMGQGSTVDELTGRARQTAYNEQTAAQAARKKAAEATLAQLQKQGLVTGDVLSKAPGMTSTPSGVLLPQSVVYEQQAAQQAAQAAKQSASPLSKFVGGAKAVANAPMVKMGAQGALAGAGAGFSGNEAISRVQSGDYPGAAIAGAGALGSLASMIPHPATRAIGTGVSMASPAALMVLDKMRQQTAKQPQRALQNVDAMGNPLP